MAEHRAGEPRQARQREIAGGYPTRRPVDSGRQRMDPPFDPITFRATVEATQDGLGRRLFLGELRELKTGQATPAELVTRDTVRRGLHRERLTPRELEAIKYGVDPVDIIRGNISTTILPQVDRNATTSYLPKMTRLDDATAPRPKIK